MQINLNKKVLRSSELGKSIPLLDGIDAQIKVLRSMMLNIDDKGSRVATNKMSEMRSSIICGSVYPLQHLEPTSLFFYS
jgi:hypothetical protein